MSTRTRDIPAADRLAANIEILDNGCWQWTGYVTPEGYGACGYQGKRHVLAHRAVYTEFVGPIAAGKTLDHTCHRTPYPTATRPPAPTGPASTLTTSKRSPRSRTPTEGTATARRPVSTAMTTPPATPTGTHPAAAAASSATRAATATRQ